MSEKEVDVLNRLGRWIINNDPSEEFLVKLIERNLDFAGITPVQKYANANGITYQGVVKTRKIIKLLGINVVIDNE